MSILKDFLGEMEGMVLKKEIQKISLGNYRGEDVNLKNIYVERGIPPFYLVAKPI